MADSFFEGVEEFVEFEELFVHVERLVLELLDFFGAVGEDEGEGWIEWRWRELWVERFCRWGRNMDFDYFFRYFYYYAFNMLTPLPVRTARSGWAFCTGGLGFSRLTMRLWTVSGAFLFLGGYGLGWMSWVATW